MPTLRAEVYDLRGRVAEAEIKINELRADHDGLKEFVEDEAKLREINDQQVALLKLADAIHEKRLRELGAIIELKK